MSERILITGGAGFIGSNLAEELVKDGYEIHILDILDEPENIYPFEDGVDYVKMDVRDEELHKFLKDVNPDGIIHLAAVSRVIWCEENPELCQSVNLGGTKNLLKAISEMRERPWLIFGSSREVYGEPQRIPVSEEFPVNPINTYGIAKVQGEKEVTKSSDEHEFKSVILRFSNVFGNERDILDRVIPRFIIRALKDEPIEIHGGNQLFDFTYIDDTVQGIVKTIKFMEKQEENGYIDTFHILTGTPTEITELPKIISKHLEKELEIRYTEPRTYDVERFYGNPEKAGKFLGYSAKVGMDEAIKRAIENLREVVE